MQAKLSCNFDMEFYDEGRHFLLGTYSTTDEAARAYIGSKESMGYMQKVSNLLSCIDLPFHSSNFVIFHVIIIERQN